MSEAIVFTHSCSKGIFTARSCGYKASSSDSLERAVERLIEKITDNTPSCVIIEKLFNGQWVATFELAL